MTDFGSDPRDRAKPPTTGVVPLDDVAGQSGLDFMRGMLDGRIPHAPITAVCGFRLVEVDEGLAVFAGQPDAALLNPLGGVHGGWITTLLDSAMGCAVHTALPAGRLYTTVELKINFARPVLPDGPDLLARGRTIHVSRRFGTAEGRLEDGDGRLYAFGTTTCFVFPADELAGR